MISAITRLHLFSIKCKRYSVFFLAYWKILWVCVMSSVWLSVRPEQNHAAFALSLKLSNHKHGVLNFVCWQSSWSCRLAVYWLWSWDSVMGDFDPGTAWWVTLILGQRDGWLWSGDSVMGDFDPGTAWWVSLILGLCDGFWGGWLFSIIIRRHEYREGGEGWDSGHVSSLGQALLLLGCCFQTVGS